MKMEAGTAIPAFLNKLWIIVQNPDTDHLICWSESGNSFYILDQAQFAKDLLPIYFKHNNMSSFVRQLNMYDFHKKMSVEFGGLRHEGNQMEFSHKYFIRGRQELLSNIKRKISASTRGEKTLPSHLTNKLLTQFLARLERSDMDIREMKKESSALWQQLSMIISSLGKHETMMNKIIHFLAVLMQGAQRPKVPIKRITMKPWERPNASSAKRTRNKASPSFHEQSPHTEGATIHELESSESESEGLYSANDVASSSRNLPKTKLPVPPSSDDNFSTLLQRRIGKASQQTSKVGAKRINGNVTLKGKKVKTKADEVEKKDEENLGDPEKALLSQLSSCNTTPPPTPPTVQKAPAVTKRKTFKKSLPRGIVRSSKLKAMEENMKKYKSIDSLLESDMDMATKESEEETDEDVLSKNEVFPSPKPAAAHRNDIVKDVFEMAIDEENQKVLEGNECDPGASTSENSIKKLASITVLDDDYIENNPYVSEANFSTAQNTNNQSLTSLSPSYGNNNYGNLNEHFSQLQNMDSNLDSLLDMVNNHCTVDSSALQQYFLRDDQMSFGLPMDVDSISYGNREEDQENPLESTMEYRNGTMVPYNSLDNVPILADFDMDPETSAPAPEAASNSLPQLTATPNNSESNNNDLNENVDEQMDFLLKLLKDDEKLEKTTE